MAGGTKSQPGRSFRTAALFLLALSAPPAAAGAQEEEETLPPPEPLVLRAADGVEVRTDLFRLRPAGEDAGLGPVVVALHGAASCRAQWRPCIPLLLGAGYAVAAPDLRFGADCDASRNETARSARRIDVGRTPLHARGDVILLLERLRRDGARPLVLAGTSLSAALALLVACERPDLVDAVVALSPYEAFGRVGRPAPYLAERAASLRRPVFATGARPEIERIRKLLRRVPEGRRRLFEPPVHGGAGLEALLGRAPDRDEVRSALLAFLRETRAAASSGAQGGHR